MREYLENNFVLQNGKKSGYAESDCSGDRLFIFHPDLSLDTFHLHENLLTGAYESYTLSVNFNDIKPGQIKRILSRVSNTVIKTSPPWTRYFSLINAGKVFFGREIGNFTKLLKEKDGKFGICISNHSIAAIITGVKESDSIKNLKLFFHILNSLDSWADASRNIKEFLNDSKYSFDENIEKFDIIYCNDKDIKMKVKPVAIMNFYSPHFKTRDPYSVLIKNPLGKGHGLPISNNPSHWLVTHAAGWTINDFSKKNTFGIHFCRILRFPEADLVEIIVHIRSSSKPRRQKSLLYSLLHEKE